MIRTFISICAIAAVLLSSPVGLPAAQTQPSTAQTEFNQTLLDQALVAFPAITKLGKSSGAPVNDEAARPHMVRICTDAGFASVEQCAATIGYLGMLFSGFDPRTGTFQDPIARMRSQIAQIEANARLPAETKDKMLAPMKQIVAEFPKNIPEAHLRLMTANRDKIFEALAARRRK